MEQAIARQVPNSRLEWIYFENAPDKCRRNIERRARERLCDDLDALEKFQRLYLIPDGVTPIPVEGYTPAAVNRAGEHRPCVS